jgi:hypothetical protein
LRVAMEDFGSTMAGLHRELAQCQSPAGGARTDLLDLHGWHVPCPCGGTAVDRPS